MGIYSNTLPCGCETLASSLEYSSNEFYSIRCFEHQPKQGDIIMYDLKLFVRLYCDAPLQFSRSCPVVAYVCESPKKYTIDDEIYHTFILRVRLPPGIKIRDKAYDLMRVYDENFGDYRLVVQYMDSLIIPYLDSLFIPYTNI